MARPQGPGDGTTPLPEAALKTYRYLRLAMVALVVMLGAAVLTEWWHTAPHCFQPSISAYYYTPARAVFVGSLVAIGVCLVILKGSTETEDTLLNLAGMLSPVVALVPVPEQGSCRSVPLRGDTIPADVANNVTALLVAGALGLLVTVVIAALARGTEGRSWWGTGLVAVVLAGFAGWFVLDRPGFVDLAHYASAVPMFVLVTVVAVMNAVGAVRTSLRRRYAGVYGVIALGMAGALAAFPFVLDAPHGVLWVEVALIGLFAVFWVTQTRELWREGLRGRP